MAGLRRGLLDVEQQDEVLVVRLLGEHDLASAPDLADTLRALVDEGLAVVVDVSAVEFLDLAVVRALLAGDQALRERGHRLALQLGTTFPVRRLLHLTGVEDAFACAEDRASAVELACAPLSEGSATK